MKRKFKNADLVFCIALIFSLLFLGIFLFAYPFSRDEAFYLSVPFRLVNGDSLVQHEWHLTQFSSLFSYLPTLIWVELTGSAEGVVVFSRCIYLSIQTALTAVIYLFFRKYKIWAVIAAILFFTQSTNVMMQISYHTMLMSFLLLLTLSVISICKKPAVYSYVFAGICYGLCCVCDPSFCFLFVIYLAFCVLWKHRKVLTKFKRKKVNTDNQIDCFSNSNSYNYFSTPKAVICIFSGILIVAVIAVAFFFMTGGTIASLINNTDNLLAFSEYKTQGSVFANLISKIGVALKTFNSLSFDTSFLLLIMFVVLFQDKKRTQNAHRCIYLLFSFILAVIYAVGAFQKYTEEIYFVEFPFFIFSVVCYIITKNKNTTLFYCMWIPGAIAAVSHFFSSNSLLSAINIILIINNTAGVFFVADLLKEMYSQQKNNSQKNKLFLKTARSVLCIALCSQLILHFSFFYYGLFTQNSNIKASVGPYSGICMTDNQFNNYTKSIADLDIIKNRADEHTPIYIASYQSNWMYIYSDLPFAAQTAYYLGMPSQEVFLAYYQENPDRIPAYIYVDYLDYNQNYNYNFARETIDILSETFGFTEEELSNGILLTVTEYKLSLTDDKTAQ